MSIEMESQGGALVAQPAVTAEQLVNASRAMLPGLLAGVTDDGLLGRAFSQASRKDDAGWKCPMISQRRKEITKE